ncbi:MAG TPA: CDP-alcohol phosphatidyltransferase family protein [Polyangiales bacterium]|nr:CDP-alcohol phosphatidyltransferase family protein [Polyangiales bacterium]
MHSADQSPKLPVAHVPALPPFETVLKSREVEDPVNLWVHRPLAYAFVALIYRTSITPNQITFMALTVGLVAGVLFLVGTKTAMLVGGICLWSSAILDGADGILARAKRLFSDVGRAIDGVADAVVGVLTVLPAFYHVWITRHSVLDLWVMPVALGTTLFHVYLFDFYKEAFLQHTKPSWDGQPETLSIIQARIERLKAERAPWYAQLTTKMYLGLVQNQIKTVTALNPRALRHHLTFPVSEESVRIYRKNNRGPMQLWALVSTAPHSYLMSICAMFDRLDVYLWLRLLGANGVFILACLWQRAATKRTAAEWAAAGVGPHSGS